MSTTPPDPWGGETPEVHVILVVTVHTTEYLGDHAREITIPLEIEEDATLAGIIQKAVNAGRGLMSGHDHIEIRVAQ